MKKLLYIDCCVRREASRTRVLAERFLAALSERACYTVESLCLMDEPLSCLTEGFFSQREALLAAGELTHPRFRYAEQFRKADRIVIAAPFWDLSFPALLKVYIENVCVENLTFGSTADGFCGLCRAKKLLFLTTRGGAYNGSPLESGARYLEAMCTFFGVDSFCCIAADGLDSGVEPPKRILAHAIGRAEQLAKEF